MTDLDPNDLQARARAGVRAHKRERILETASRLFFEGGYRATSVESIADELNATKPFIYYHFKSKYDILDEIAMRVVRMANEAIERGAADFAGDPPKQLAEMVRRYVELVFADRQMIAVFWREESNFSDDTRARVVAGQRQFCLTLASVLQDGATSGCFRVEHPRLTALSIMNLLTLLYTWYRPDGLLSERELAAHFVDHTLRMVAP